MATPSLAQTPDTAVGTAGTGTVSDTVSIGASATHVISILCDNGNPGTTTTIDPGGGDETAVDTALFARFSVSSGANVTGLIKDISAAGLNGSYTVQSDTTESTKSISQTIIVINDAANGTIDADQEGNATNGSPVGLTLTATAAAQLLIGIIYNRDNRTVTRGGDLATDVVDEATVYAGEISVATLDISSAADYDSTWTFSGNTGYYNMAIILGGTAVGGDPEGPLVGGKLVRGGILIRGRLVA